MEAMKETWTDERLDDLRNEAAEFRSDVAALVGLVATHG